MQTEQSNNVGMLVVLKYLWKAVSPQKWAVYFTISAFLVTNVISILIPLIYKKFFDILAQDGDKLLLSPSLIKLILYIFFLHCVIWVFFRVGMLALNKLESRTMARIRQMSFDYMLKHSYSFYTNNFTGSLVQKVSRFSRSFERLYDMLVFNVIPLVIHATGVIIVVYFQEPFISYIILAWITIIFIFNYFFQKWKLKYDLLATKADSATSGALADALSNQNTIVSFNGFLKESEDFKKITLDQSDKQIHTWNLSIIKDLVQSGLMIIVELVIFYYAIKFWERDLITVGTFVLIQVYILGLSNRLWDFGRIIRNIYESFADSKEMVEILEMPYEIKDIPTAKNLNVTKGEIEFKNVNFAFNQTRNVLDDINLRINNGEKVALIGPSGAGKSTIVKLLLRMYDLTSGAIEIDGQNIKEATQNSLRQNISLVPQDPVLFHRTLMDNIRYGRENATDEEVMEASKLAHCDEFIQELPLKYETFVGERGIKLSGGERQRVAIARAILKNAPILILDEATSSLDSHSESLIQDALEKLMHGKTSIVIAHRLSTIRKMDKVIVIKDGKVAEEGSHEELTKREEGIYKNLWELQAGGFLPE
jgi:ATP-binding cassette, subfamily B, bacterial